MTYLNMLWHFHQPWYVMPDAKRLNISTITFRVLYNYYPLARIIESSGAKITCNFTVPLLLQIKKIADGEIIDGFQEILETESSNDISKIKLFCDEIPEKIKSRNNILMHLIRKMNSEKLSKQELYDLKMWIHLICFHPVMNKYFPEIGMLKEKGIGFNRKDMEVLSSIEKNVFSQVIPIYRKLSDSGSIEISTTPGYHPIMPLIHNISVAKKTRTSFQIPDIEFQYPDDVDLHIKMGLDTAESFFGNRPSGIWPAEGSLSDDVLDKLNDHGILWVGADEQILYASDTEKKDISSFLYLWKDSFNIFFRNHWFSDRIGFIYQSWNEKDAAVDLVGRIDQFSKGQEKILTIIFDGENPWEWYREQGSIFLKEFYSMAMSSNNIKMISMSQARNLDFKRVSLNSIHPGSWMGLHFDNWIGCSDANRLWRILSDARKAVQQYTSKLDLQEKIKNLVLMAESSDFLWWMSVPAEQSVKIKFYTLFQAIISKIYEETGLDVPAEVMEEWLPETKINEPEGYITPTIDGKITDFFEWQDAAEIRIEKLWTTFQPFDLPIKQILYGYDRDNIYLRIDPEEKNFSSILVENREGVVFSFEIEGVKIVKENIGVDKCIEISAPLEKFIDGDRISFALRLRMEETEIRIPPAGFLFFTRKFFEDDWKV